MKTLVICFLAAAAFLFLPACTTMEDRDEASVPSITTTTEERTMGHPAGGTTETRTIHSN